jgi:hypothetical protein
MICLIIFLELKTMRLIVGGPHATPTMLVIMPSVEFGAE